MIIYYMSSNMPNGNIRQEQSWFILYFLGRQKRSKDQEFDGRSVKYWSRPIFATDGIATNHSAGVTKATANIYCRKHLLLKTFVAMYCQQIFNNMFCSTHVLPKTFRCQSIAKTHLLPFIGKHLYHHKHLLQHACIAKKHSGVKSSWLKRW